MLELEGISRLWISRGGLKACGGRAAAPLAIIDGQDGALDTTIRILGKGNIGVAIAHLLSARSCIPELKASLVGIDSKQRTMNFPFIYI